MATNAPHNPNKLVGTKWTAVDPEHRRRHWEIISYRRSDGQAELESVLDGEHQLIAWRELRDREKWRPGWER